MQAIANNSQPSPPPASAASARTGEHLYTLDILRAVAALVVAAYHWQHFGGKYFSPNADTTLPWQNVVPVLYAGGGRAVELFFTLSGFVFFWLYSEKVAAHRINGWTFGALRFSRLYPLHFVTLLFVGTMQFIVAQRLGHAFVYPENTAAKFIQHLFFVSDWGAPKELGFNGPAWSVSVEVFLYIAFFAVCRVGLRRWWQLLLLALSGTLLMRLGLHAIGLGVFSFFLGGLCFLAYRALKSKIRPASLNALTIFTIALWFVIPYSLGRTFFYSEFKARFGSSLNLAGRDVIGAILLSAGSYAHTALLFPFTVLALALNDARWNRFTQQIAFLGNMSYSSYLLHFPLQLVFLAVVLFGGIDPHALVSPWTFCLFFAALIPLSLASYSKFERPMQDFLRRRLINTRT